MFCPLLSLKPHQTMRILCQSMQNLVFFRLIFFQTFIGSALEIIKQYLRSHKLFNLCIDVLFVCYKFNGFCCKIAGLVSPHFGPKALRIKANFTSIDAEFCPLSTHIFSRFLSPVVWKLSNNLCDLTLERPSLHNGSTLIGLEKTKEIQFFELNS